MNGNASLVKRGSGCAGDLGQGPRDRAAARREGRVRRSADFSKFVAWEVGGHPQLS